MRLPMIIPHAKCVNRGAIEARFSNDRLHRYSLKIPFLERTTGKLLCIVGQNPSEANEINADKTIHYLENFVFKNLPEYDGIVMLNLYTRMDKYKDKNEVLDDRSDEKFKSALTKGSDVLLIIGKLKNEKAYKFKDRARQLRKDLEQTNLYKLAINTTYAPHPGNPKITYSNMNIGINEYKFEDM